MISVLMLTYKRPELTAKCFESYIENHGDFPHTLSLVNNCGTKEVLDVIEAYRPQMKHLKEVILNKNCPTLSHCTNHFWRTSDTEYVAKLDSDTMFPKDFLKTLYDSITIVRAKDSRFFCLHARHYEGVSLFGTGNKEFEVNGIHLLTASHGGGCCYIAHRPTLRALGDIASDNNLRIMGWTAYQHYALERGKKLALIRDLHVVHAGIGEEHSKMYPEYVDEIWVQRHGKKRT